MINTTNVLNEKEVQEYVDNRTLLQEELAEIQSDLEDLSNEELLELRNDILSRVNTCLKLIIEKDEDNLK